MNDLAGLGPEERKKLSKLLRETQLTISISEAVKILAISRAQAAQLLARLCQKGWLLRIQAGIYIPIELPAMSKDVVAEEPFAIAEKLFSPCYIGGVSAATYWDLSEQIFRTVTVMTQKPIRKRNPSIAGNEYWIHTVKQNYFFGLTAMWFNDVKVNISDPSRTIIDMMIFPHFCGGLRFIIDVFKNYYISEHKNTSLLITYLQKANNGAAIKRMGFIVEKFFPTESELLDYCLQNLTEGYIKLSPSQDCPRLNRRWRLWIPDSWKENIHDQ